MSNLTEKHFIVLYSLATLALHYKTSNEARTAKTRLIEWPRTPENEATLIAMAKAGNASLERFR